MGARVSSSYLILTFSLILLTLILWGFSRSTVQFAANFILYILTTASAIQMFAPPLLHWISQRKLPPRLSNFLKKLSSRMEKFFLWLHWVFLLIIALIYLDLHSLSKVFKGSSAHETLFD